LRWLAAPADKREGTSRAHRLVYAVEVDDHRGALAAVDDQRRFTRSRQVRDGEEQQRPRGDDAEHELEFAIVPDPHLAVQRLATFGA